MADLPTADVIPWASDANFTAPGESWDGTPTKVEPTVGKTAGVAPEGHFYAQHFNWLQSHQQAWLSYLRDARFASLANVTERKDPTPLANTSFTMTRPAFTQDAPVTLAARHMVYLASAGSNTFVYSESNTTKIQNRVNIYSNVTDEVPVDLISTGDALRGLVAAGVTDLPLIVCNDVQAINTAGNWADGAARTALPNVNGQQLLEMYGSTLLAVAGDGIDFGTTYHTGTLTHRQIASSTTGTNIARHPVTGTYCWTNTIGQIWRCAGDPTVGANWQLVMNSTGSRGATFAGFGANLWVHAPTNAQSIYVSTNDGLTWTGYTFSEAIGLALGMLVGCGEIVAINRGALLYTSTDGIRWVKHRLPFSAADLGAANYVPGRALDGRIVYAGISKGAAGSATYPTLQFTPAITLPTVITT